MNLIKTPAPIHTIITHTLPHQDEYYARYLLEKFGEKHFPGATNAKLIVMHRSDVQKKTFEQWLAEGFLLIGVGGGPLDEHPVNGTERTLVWDVDSCEFYDSDATDMLTLPVRLRFVVSQKQRKGGSEDLLKRTLAVEAYPRSMQW